MTASRIYKIGFRKPLMLGCDRRGIILLAGLAAISLYSQTWVGAAYAVIIWFPGLFLLRKLGDYDPLIGYGYEHMLKRYGRQHYYAPRSTPHRGKFRFRRSMRFAPRKPLVFM